jgi:alcohol dehydrogenase YqhD (iron-dependent ADH family)
MKIKIMYPNRDGRLEFSKNELEKLLEEAYNEGYKDGKNSNSYTVRDYTCYPSVSYLNGVTYNTDGAYSTHTVDSSLTAVSGLTVNADNTVSLGTVELKGNVE